MTPTCGRTVVYVQPADELPVNGTREHPAIITRVWGDTGVNLQVLFDAGDVAPRTSVRMIDAARPDAGGWKWPERTA